MSDIYEPSECLYYLPKVQRLSNMQEFQKVLKQLVNEHKI